METNAANPEAVTAKASAEEASAAPAGGRYGSKIIYGSFAFRNRGAVATGATRLGRKPELSRTAGQFLTQIHRLFEMIWRRLRVRARRAPKPLLVTASVALGDRRLVAVVECEGQRFLIGSSPSAITLLAALPRASGSDDVHATHCETTDSPAQGAPQ